MASYSDAAKNAATDAINALVDGGSLVLLGGTTVIGTITLASPAFAAASSGQASLNSTSTVQASAGGTIDSYELRDSGGTMVMSGTAGEAGTNELVLAEATVQSGQNLSASGITHNAMAAAA